MQTHVHAHMGTHVYARMRVHMRHISRRICVHMHAHKDRQTCKASMPTLHICAHTPLHICAHHTRTAQYTLIPPDAVEQRGHTMPAPRPVPFPEPTPTCKAPPAYYTCTFTHMYTHTHESLRLRATRKGYMQGRHVNLDAVWSYSVES